MYWFEQLQAMVLDNLAETWPAPTRIGELKQDWGEPGSLEYGIAYARFQYKFRVQRGLNRGWPHPEIQGKKILEIGCGSGGISCYLASLGAKHVVGIDVNEDALRAGRAFANEFETPPPVQFVEADALALPFDDASFDMAYADNFFEHAPDYRRVLSEARRILRKGGHLLVPIFSSIWSKYGLHLKRGLKLPWANLVFSERVIVNTLKRRAEREPKLLEWYPGLATASDRVREVRKHGDLNDITYRQFKNEAAARGFRVEDFHVMRTRLGNAAHRLLPGSASSQLDEVLSTGAGATLVAV